MKRTSALMALTAYLFWAISVPCIITPTAAAQDCLNYEEYLHYVGNVSIPGVVEGRPMEVVVVGGYAYVASGGNGVLRVIDITNPASPLIVSSVEIPGMASGVAVAGGYAYVIIAETGFHVIEVSNPASPVAVASLELPGVVSGIATAGTYAYVAAGWDNGLQVIDITNPASPFIAGSISTPGSAGDVAVAGGYAYVADGESGLQVIDITNPTSPSIAGFVSTPGGAADVAVAGDYALVGSSYPNNLFLIDITDPPSPHIVGSLTPEGSFHVGVVASGSYAYVSSTAEPFDEKGYLEVVDITNPSSPHVVAKLVKYYIRGAAISDSNIFMIAAGSSWNLCVLDIANPASPPVVGSVVLPGSGGLVVSGSFAFVACSYAGLKVIDISVPESPVIVGSMDTDGRTFSVAIADNYAFVADGNHGVQVIDISNPASPQIVSGVYTPDQARDVAVLGSYAYVADRRSGLQVIDISNPAIPQIVGSIGDPLSFAHDVAVAGRHAYVADYETGFHVINITNPELPIVAYSINTSAYGVTIAGSFAYLTGPGLQVFDVSVPESPVVLGSVDEMPGNFGSVEVLGNHAYIGGGIGLSVVDITNPALPHVLGFVGHQIPNSGVAVSNNFVLFNCSDLNIAWRQCEEALAVDIDIKPGNETNPINCKSRNGVVPVAILTTDIFDATTVDHTTVRFGPDEAAEAHENPHGPIRHDEDVDHDGDMDLLFHFRFNETGIQCGDTEATLTGQTYDGFSFSGNDHIRTVPDGGSDERQAQLIQVNPNPFNPNTTLTFSLDHAQGVRISVFDMAGRRVAAITDRVYGTGSHTVDWNGKDSFGRAVSSGPYLVRIETDGWVESQKIMLVR